MAAIEDRTGVLASHLHNASVATARIADERDQADIKPAIASPALASSRPGTDTVVPGSAAPCQVSSTTASGQMARGQWLREQRQARGWNIPEMCRQLRRAADSAGDRLPGNDALITMVRRWEKDNGGVSERYRLYFCRVFGIPPGQFGTALVPATPAGTGTTSEDSTTAPGTSPPEAVPAGSPPFLPWPGFTLVIALACPCICDHRQPGPDRAGNSAAT
jgi:hypothetical protein